MKRQKSKRIDHTEHTRHGSRAEHPVHMHIAHAAWPARQPQQQLLLLLLVERLVRNPTLPPSKARGRKCLATQIEHMRRGFMELRIFDHLFVIWIDPQIAHLLGGKCATMQIQIVRWWWWRRAGQIPAADSDCILGESRTSSNVFTNGHNLDRSRIQFFLL